MRKNKSAFFIAKTKLVKLAPEERGLISYTIHCVATPAPTIIPTVVPAIIPAIVPAIVPAPTVIPIVREKKHTNFLLCEPLEGGH